MSQPNLKSYSVDQLIEELESRGITTQEGLIKPEIYKLVTDLVPISCVDIIPVRTINDSFAVGVIVRKTGHEAGKIAIIGGGIRKDESIDRAIMRHLNKDLQINNYDLYESHKNSNQPFFVQQYFHKTKSQDTGYDPTKHAIALNYLIIISEEPKPKNEANKFLWIKEGKIPKETAFNHGIVLKQAFKFLKTLK